jgi:1-acyl-sn-glycerol-3-phosphate acyltransferase
VLDVAEYDGRRTARVAEFVYRPVIGAALGLFGALDVRFDLRGIENIPATGGAVLASNHVSYLDFMFVGLAAHHRGRRLVRFLAKRSVFDHRVSGPLMRGMHHIPVDRAAGTAAYKDAVVALQAGELVGVFPEQTISRSFVPRPMKAGAARMAAEAGVPLLPVVTWGGQRIWTSGRRPRLLRHIPVSVHVGPPIATADVEPVAATAALADTIDAMVDVVLRGYPRPEPVGDLWWWPARAAGGAPMPEAAADAERHSISGKRPKA